MRLGDRGQIVGLQKGFPPEWSQYAKKVQRKPNQGGLGIPGEVGWLHRQGLIRHRVPPSTLKAWAASKGKGLLPKEIAAGSRKRYYKGGTEEDVAEILDYYFSHGMSSIRTRKHFAFAFSDNGLRNWARKDPRRENRHGILDADSEKARKAFEGKGGREPVPSAATTDPPKAAARAPAPPAEPDEPEFSSKDEEIEWLRERNAALKLRSDVLAETAKLAKKETGIDYWSLKAAEKAGIVDALANKHPVVSLLKELGLARAPTTTTAPAASWALPMAS